MPIYGHSQDRTGIIRYRQTDRQIETAEQELQTNKTVFQGTVRVNWSGGAVQDKEEY